MVTFTTMEAGTGAFSFVPSLPVGVIFIGYAIETPRAEAPLHAASTPALQADLAVGHASGAFHRGESKGLVLPMKFISYPQNALLETRGGNLEFSDFFG
jgi:hypothetical protein